MLISTPPSLPLTQSDLASCHGILEERQSEAQGLRQQVGQQLEQEQKTRAELDSLRAELGKLTSSEETLQSKLATRERKIGHLEDKLADALESKSRRSEQVRSEVTGRPCDVWVVSDPHVHHLKVGGAAGHETSVCVVSLVRGVCRVVSDQFVIVVSAQRGHREHPGRPRTAHC